MYDTIVVAYNCTVRWYRRQYPRLVLVQSSGLLLNSPAFSSARRKLSWRATLIVLEKITKMGSLKRGISAVSGNFVFAQGDEKDRGMWSREDQDRALVQGRDCRERAASKRINPSEYLTKKTNLTLGVLAPVQL